MTDDTRLGVQAQQHEDTWNDRGKCCGYIIPRLFIGMRGWKLRDDSWWHPQSRFLERFYHGDGIYGRFTGEKKSTEGATSLAYDQCEMDEQLSKGDSTLIIGCRCNGGDNDQKTESWGWFSPYNLWAAMIRLLNVGVVGVIIACACLVFRSRGSDRFYRASMTHQFAGDVVR